MLKKVPFWPFLVGLASMLQGCGGGACSPDSVVDGTGTPRIVLSSVPPIGSTNALTGKALHVAPANYNVVVYIYVPEFEGWWEKPYIDSPLTAIGCGDGSWSTDITTGGDDTLATQIAVFLVPSTFNPPTGNVGWELPEDLYTNSVANVLVNR